MDASDLDPLLVGDDGSGSVNVIQDPANANDNPDEVIDNGGEPISTGEYYGVGKVTEFRTSSWVGSCIQNNDFGCLEGFGNVSEYHVWK